MGMRACLCFEVSDRDGAAAAQAGIQENLALAERAGTRGGDRLRALFGLHASFTLGEATLAACARAARQAGLGCHVHVAEDRADQERCRTEHGQSAIQRLAAAEILGPRTLCIHGVHLTDPELELLASSRCWLVHCPRSNMNNAVGAVQLARLQAAGVRLALGTDGFSANVIQEAQCAHLLQNHLAADPRAGFATVPTLPFTANARLASEAFGIELGRLRVGAPADLVVWEYDPPTPLTIENWWGHVLFGLVHTTASDVWIAGRHLLNEGRCLCADERELAARTRAAAERVWARF
jgi:cytosine/adenosine deaminase-related metal-dependent hydrolase